MRTLSSALLNAQKSASGVPYVKVEVVDKVAGVARLRWARLYTGSEDDFYHAAAMPADGSLIRARVSSADQLYLQRVASPGPGSDFSAWTGLGSVSSASGIALTSRSSSVLLFYVEADQKTITVRESTDNGGSFGSPVTVTTAATAVGWLAAGINPSGVVALFYTVGATVYVIKRTGGSWGSPSAWTNSVAGITGLACVYQLDWDLALAGTDNDSNYHLWTLLYGDGYGQSTGTWSGLTSVSLASSGSGMEFHTPFLDYPDAYRIFFIEQYTGTVSYTRPYWGHTTLLSDYADGLWREPVPFNLTSSYGVALAHDSAYAWISTPSGVWRAALIPTTVNLSADVLDLRAETEPFAGRLAVILRNDDGRYNSPGAGGYAPISFGSEIRVSPGYQTSSGSLTSSGLAYWIGDWEHRSAPGEARFVLYGADGWALLTGWRARQQFAWAAGARNVFQLLAFVLARAGLDLTSYSNSSTLVDHYPSFTIQPGESGLRAVQRLLEMVPDRLFIEGASGYLLYPQSSDASVYSYGTDHAVLAGGYRSTPKSVNQAQAHGKAVFAEAFDWAGIDDVYGRVRQSLDQNLDSDGEAANRAAAELRRAAVEAPGGHLLVPANCGQQLYDVIDITDGRAGLSAAVRRVLGLALTYQRSPRPRYDLRLDLGGV